MGERAKKRARVRKVWTETRLYWTETVVTVGTEPDISIVEDGGERARPGKYPCGSKRGSGWMSVGSVGSLVGSSPYVFSSENTFYGPGCRCCRWT